MPYENLNQTDESRGSWIVGSRASQWKLLLAKDGLFVESSDMEPVEIESQALSVKGVSMFAVKRTIYPLDRPT